MNLIWYYDLVVRVKGEKIDIKVGQYASVTTLCLKKCATLLWWRFHQTLTNFKHSFTAEKLVNFPRKQYTIPTTPKLCCHTTSQNLNVQICCIFAYYTVWHVFIETQCSIVLRLCVVIQAEAETSAAQGRHCWTCCAKETVRMSHVKRHHDRCQCSNNVGTDGRSQAQKDFWYVPWWWCAWKKTEIFFSFHQQSQDSTRW